MRHFHFVCLIALIAVPSLSDETANDPPPQTARQALIEMFFGNGPDDLQKHLPDEARRALVHKGETPDSSVVLRLSVLAREFGPRNENFKVLDDGPYLLIRETPETHERLEVPVEHDSYMGDEDEIELSVHLYKNGQERPLPVIPRLTFTLKQEAKIWKLTDVTVSAHAPLTDPDYLAGVRKQQDESNQSTVQGRLWMVVNSERAYASAHPERGFTCSLSELFGPAEGSEMPPYAGDEVSGYRLALSGCTGKPATKFRVSAVPIESDSTMKTLCSDESGSIKSISADQSSSCFTDGDETVKVLPADGSD